MATAWSGWLRAGLVDSASLVAASLAARQFWATLLSSICRSVLSFGPVLPVLGS